MTSFSGVTIYWSQSGGKWSGLDHIGGASQTEKKGDRTGYAVKSGVKREGLSGAVDLNHYENYSR